MADHHHEPIVIDPIVQKEEWDCGVACLAMLLGRAYADVRARVRKCPDGLSNRQMMRCAAALGQRLSHRPHVGDDDVGILDLEREINDRWEGHFALYIRGAVYNPASGQLWPDVDTYLQYSRYRVCGIFVRAA